MFFFKPKLTHYKGDLGEFNYNPKEFEIRTERNPWNQEKPYYDTIRYIGNKVDGRRITIPEGLTKCDDMFAGSDLVLPPKIPSSVKSCSHMFHHCTYLLHAPEIPDGVENIAFMFNGCTALRGFPARIPGSVTDFCYAFGNCPNVTVAPYIEDNPDGKLKHMTGAFEYCTGLKIPPKIPPSTSMSMCFKGCSSLRTTPEIPEGVNSIDYCFADCISLRYASMIPKSCHYANSAFDNCVRLKEPPILEDSAFYHMDSMFRNCKSLQKAPVFPSRPYGCYTDDEKNIAKVIDRAFQECPDFVKEQAQWNMLHCGEHYLDHNPDNTPEDVKRERRIDRIDRRERKAELLSFERDRMMRLDEPVDARMSENKRRLPKGVDEICRKITAKSVKDDDYGNT